MVYTVKMKNASSENLSSSDVLVSSFLLRSNRMTLQCKHRSIEFLTTQTDQSKSNIFIDYVLTFSFPPSFEYALNFVKYLSFAIL